VCHLNKNTPLIIIILADISDCDCIQPAWHIVNFEQ